MNVIKKMNTGVVVEDPRRFYPPARQFTAIMWCCKCVGNGWVDVVYPVQGILVEAYRWERLEQLKRLFAEAAMHPLTEIG